MSHRNNLIAPPQVLSSKSCSQLIESIPAKKIVENKMNLTNSWTNHFIAIGNSDKANKNIAFFRVAMKPDQTKSEKIINLVKEDNIVALVIGKAGQI